MRWLDRLRFRIRSLLWRHRVERELEQELQFHLDQQTDENRRAGMGAEAARASALRTTGSTLQIKEQCRDSFGLRTLDELRQDVRYTCRSLIGTPGFALVAIATLALGIGATTTIVSLVNAVLLRPLPFPEPDRLVALVNTQHGRTTAFPFTSATRLQAWREHAVSVHDLSAYMIGPAVNLTAVGPPQQVVSGRVTADFFRLFGAHFVKGRAFTADEDRPGGPRVAIVSHGLWQRQWGGDAAIIGRTLSINGETFTVVGVLDGTLDARSLQPDLARSPDLWLPLQLDPHTRDDANILLAVGRLESGVDITVADQQAQRAAETFRQTFPKELLPSARFGVVRLKTLIVGEVRPSLLLLLGAVGLVTLIVCVNTANLMLGRATARRREFALRTALGASGGRLIRQLLTESVVLAAAGGLVGCLIGSLGIPVVLGLQGVLVPRIGVVDPYQLLDVHVLLFTVMTSTACGVLCGLVPALRAASTDVESDLRGGRGLTSGSRARHLRTVLLVAEMSIACVLVIGSVLLLRSLTQLLAVNPGFNTRHVLTMRTALADRRFATTAGAARVADNGLARLTALPGVASAAISLAGVPLALGGGAFAVSVVGRQMDRQYVERWDAISPQYFDVFQIRLVRGRLFTDRDTRAGRSVAMINEAMARQLWPGGDPLRDQILIGQGAGPSFEEPVPRAIVGIVASVR
jgi:predicted permease